ncbi:MAG: hypothetical protein HYX79_06175 [Chloroflexi bacterium]|nr:hypothetical protein [Chloroflexota bacterium]
MKVEKLELVGLNVKNLDEAVKLYSDILGIDFVYADLSKVKRKKAITEHADRAAEERKTRYAMDRTGFMELVESTPPVEKEGVRNIHFKVPDLEQAKAEMKQKGIRLIADVTVGNLKEAIFCPDDLLGVRLCLLEYDAPSAIDAIMQR